MDDNRPIEHREETYRGRRIRVEIGPRPDGSEFAVHIDGRRLRTMRLADGTHISQVCHYVPHADPVRVARAAVDEMRTGGLAGTGHGSTEDSVPEPADQARNRGGAE